MRRLTLAVGLATCVLVPSLLFLGRYVVDGTGVAPAGSDTSQHVWRSEVVAENGLEALPAFDGRSQALNTNADRPGLPLIFSSLSAVTGADVRDLAYVLPAVLAAAIALAAAALAGAVPGVPGWGMALAGVSTGASVQVALAANGYLDQLLVEPLLVMAGACVLRAAGGGPGRALGAAALVAAWLVHWQFALLFTVLLGVVSLASLPASLRDRRQGLPLIETASGRVGTTVVGGAGLGIAALLFGTPGIPHAPIGLSRGSVDRHLSDQLARYRLPAAVAAAMVGGTWLAVDGSEPSRRRAGWLLVPWALVPAAAALAFAAGRTVPLQRALSFSLAIPVLGALGLVAAVLWTRGRFGSVAAGAVGLLAVMALIFSVTFAWETWRTRKPWSQDQALAEFRALGSYLIEAGRPAIVVVDEGSGQEKGAEGEFGTVPVMRRIRAELPAHLAMRTTVYLGDAEFLTEGRPTLRPEIVGFDEVSRETWLAARVLLADDPTIVVLRSHLNGFAEAIDAHPEWRTNGWMAVVAGPPPPIDPPVVPERPSSSALFAWWVSSLAVIALPGAGWSARFGGGPFGLRMALAPATGLAALVFIGLLVERLGVRTGGGGGMITAIVIAASGVLAAIIRRPAERSA
ncbi:MAG TPA: hypothetical protein VF195_05750 [Actinomycetota bacterium]